MILDKTVIKRIMWKGNLWNINTFLKICERQIEAGKTTSCRVLQFCCSPTRVLQNFVNSTLVKHAHAHEASRSFTRTHFVMNSRNANHLIDNQSTTDLFVIKLPNCKSLKKSCSLKY